MQAPLSMRHISDGAVLWCPVGGAVLQRRLVGHTSGPRRRTCGRPTIRTRQAWISDADDRKRPFGHACADEICVAQLFFQGQLWENEAANLQSETTRIHLEDPSTMITKHGAKPKTPSPKALVGTPGT